MCRPSQRLLALESWAEGLRQELPPLFRQLIKAFESIQVPFRLDPHGSATMHGVGGVWRSMGCGHARCWPARLPRLRLAAGRPRATTFQQLGAPLLASPAHHLRVVTQAYVERVLLEDGRAVGVEVSIAEGHTVQRRLRFRAAREVVLATGVLATPKLLTLSGIAEPRELERLGVPLKVASPAVSRHFHEHVGCSIVVHTNMPCASGPKNQLKDHGLAWKNRVKVEAFDQNVPISSCFEPSEWSEMA